MKKRIIRLYPSITIFTLISLILQLRDITIKNIADIATGFIWPTYYWFVGALILYYILIYLLERIEIVSSKFVFFSIVYGSILLLYYEGCIYEKNIWCMETMGFDTFESWMKVVSFFYVFSLGYYLKKNKEICKIISKQYSVFITLVGGIGYMGYKLLLVKNYIPMRFQIVAPLFLYVFAFGMICLAVKCGRSTEVGKNKETITKKIVRSLSSLSLEVYVVQFPVIHFFEHYIFPLNIVMALLVTFSLAYLLKIISFYSFRFIGCIYRSCYCSSGNQDETKYNK